MAEEKKTTTKSTAAKKTTSSKSTATKTTTKSTTKATAAKKTTAKVEEVAKAPVVEEKVEVKEEVKAPAKKAGPMLKIKLVKSASGRLSKQQKTLVALGLTKINSETVKPDNAQTRGMIFVVKHLVEVESVKEN